MKDAYLHAIGLIERLHRQFLEVVREELDRLGIRDINNVQSLILFNIADGDFTVGELTLRGYYLGTNVTYNLKKMVEHGYVVQEPSPHDRRSVRVQLSEKGRELWKALDEAFERHAGDVGDGVLDAEALETANAALDKLGRYWGRTVSLVNRAA